MRNGDLPPSRFDAQAETVTMLFNAKRQSNVENSVSLMTMAETRYLQSSSLLLCSPKVLVTLTNDPNKISHAINSVKLGGGAHFVSALQVAQVLPSLAHYIACPEE
jgi:26S proteasome regulatory subunit N10